MKSLKVQCGKCKETVSFPLSAPSLQASCPACGTPVTIEIFRALFKPPAPGQSGEKLVIDDQSSCFYHPSKKAVIPCESCGRFLCSLCDVEFNGRHLCPTCIESGAKKGKIPQPGKDTVYYDELALALTLAPLIFFFYPTIITAPIALYVAIRYRNAPLSVAPRSRWRFAAAMIISSVEIMVWVVIIYGLFIGK